MIIKNSLKVHLLLLVIATFFGCSTPSNKESDAQVTKAEIRMTDQGYRIFLNGEPFYVKGAGVGQSSKVEDLVLHGANAARTWSTHHGEEILDLAYENGLKVVMGIWIVPERLGADFDDEDYVKEQFEQVREKVLELKDHPALMCWAIGNELNHHAHNPKVWDAVNDISKMIHEVDPNHLTTTTLAGFNPELVKQLETRAPDLDFYSIQLYGPIDQMEAIIDSAGYNGPLLVTEWGATGYWEVPKTAWGAPIENQSSKKADLYLSRYQNAIVGQTRQVMGSFVFLWGNKQERTPTWFGMHLPDGTETEAVDMMHYAWKGEWPTNRTSRLSQFTIDGKQPADNIKLKAGQTYTAQVDISDPDSDPLTYRWEVMEESTSNKTGGDAEEVPATIEGLFMPDAHSMATFQAPDTPGAYRLFVYVYDSNNHAAHANIPFWVD
ncbi:MAG: hypothetical protein JXR10_08860 [Cyclobacteriaceae bacterium]